MPPKGLMKIASTGIGMAAEYNAHRKEKKQLSRENSQQSDLNSQQNAGTPPITGPPPSYDDALEVHSYRDAPSATAYTDDKKDSQISEDYEGDVDDYLGRDDEIWDLDEAVDREQGRSSSPPESEEQSTQKQRDAWAQEVIVSYHTAITAAGPSFQRSPLPCPVIIPQRRPRSKGRGFVRAYAPYLGECNGISQETFLLFLENFDKASQASSAFTVIQISAAIAGLAPSIIAMIVTNAVQIATEAGRQVQMRQRTNDFLDRMNEDLFKPAGLYAMIVKYKSEAEAKASGNVLLARFGIGGEKVDLSTNQTIAKYNRSQSEESKSKFQNFRLASSTTKGAMQLPESAPLIFPQIDKQVAIEGEETFKMKAKDARNVLADYIDRRAQTKYATADPNSSLNIPEDQRAFRSKLSDPNHPMYNGGLIGLVSGGHLSRGSGRREQRSDRRMLQAEQRPDYGRSSSRDGGRRRRGGLISGLVGAATDAYNNRDQGKSGGYGDAYDGRQSSQQGSYGGPAPHAPYGGQQGSGSQGYAPHGGQSSSSSQQALAYRPRERRQGGIIGTVKKVMQEDVLYLMIVNMPSEAELQEARETMAAVQAGR